MDKDTKIFQYIEATHTRWPYTALTAFHMPKGKGDISTYLDTGGD